MTASRKTGFFVLLLILVLGSLPLVSYAQSATPRRGEGIWALLRRNGITPSNSRVEAFRTLNQRHMRGGDQLLRGVVYKLPSSGSNSEFPTPQGNRYPIFGVDYEWVTRKSSLLKGHVYYIVSGHGGPDPGTGTRLNGLAFTEDEIAYDTALRTARRLLEEGAIVYIIVRDPNDGIRDAKYLAADHDEVYLGGIAMSRNQGRRLQKRADIINDLYARHRRTATSQQVIALHVDAFDDGPVQPQIDVHFSYTSATGRALGKTLSDEFRDQYKLHQPTRGYRGRVVRHDWMILNATKPVAVLIELGNIRHRGDQVRLAEPANRQAIADWLTRGLIRKTGGRRS